MKMKLINYILWIFLITFCCFFVFFIIDFNTQKTIGIKEVTCYDRNGNLINNVTCSENITCSKFGFAGYYKCKDLENIPYTQYKCLSPILKNGYLYCDIEDIK